MFNCSFWYFFVISCSTIFDLKKIFSWNHILTENDENTCDIGLEIQHCFIPFHTSFFFNWHINLQFMVLILHEKLFWGMKLMSRHMSQFIRVLLFHCSDVIHPENTVKKKRKKYKINFEFQCFIKICSFFMLTSYSLKLWKSCWKFHYHLHV